MKSINTKAMLVTHLLVIPPTSFVTFLLLGQLTFSVVVMLLTVMASAIGVLLSSLFFTKVLRRLAGMRWYWLYGVALIVLAQLTIIFVPLLLNDTLAAFANGYTLVTSISFLASAMLLLSETMPKKGSKKGEE